MQLINHEEAKFIIIEDHTRSLASVNAKIKCLILPTKLSIHSKYL